MAKRRLLSDSAALQAQALYGGGQRTPQEVASGIASSVGAPVLGDGQFNVLDFGKDHEDDWYDLPEWERTKLMSDALRGRDVPLMKKE